jgi:hypothetical protein
MPDHAIVVGIGHYPALGPGGTQPNDLPGAIADADAMADWLANSAGAQVTKITSTGYNGTPWNVAEIRPKIGDVHDAIQPLATANQRIGNRLYVYVAGHGIAPEPRSRCLILADAKASLVQWIPNFEAPAWIDWLARQTQFDEFVLWMDCCGTQGFEYERGRPPANTTGAARAVPDARVFMAFASGNGREAYEGPNKDGVVRGQFTDRLLRGLEGKAADFDGEVRSASLASYLRNGNAAVADGNTETVPTSNRAEVVQQDDMVFAVKPHPVYKIWVKTTAGAAPSNGTAIILTAPPTTFRRTAQVNGGWVEFALPVGMFKLAGPDITPQFIEIGADTPPRIEQ